MTPPEEPTRTDNALKSDPRGHPPIEETKVQCFSCLAKFDGYPRVEDEIRCPKCGSYEVHLAHVGRKP